MSWLSARHMLDVHIRQLVPAVDITIHTVLFDNPLRDNAFHMMYAAQRLHVDATWGWSTRRVSCVL